MNLGAHMSIAGGIHKALERGRSAGCHAVQIFTKNQTRWACPPLKHQEVEIFHSLKSEFYSVFVHASYLINLASPDEELFFKSVRSLAVELDRCRILGLKLLILHPGFSKEDDKANGIRRIIRGLEAAYDQSDTAEVEILLETMSGQGSVLGSRFEELREIMGELKADGYPAGICLDTCHIFSAGYDLREPESYHSTWAEFEEKLGLSSLKVIHLNDSKGELGSHIDRHEHIGQGKIGLKGFELMVSDPRLKNIPMSLETPKGPGLEEDIKNLNLLRSLRL